MDKRVKSAALELLVAKVIQVTRDQTATLVKLVNPGHQGTMGKRVTQASLGGQDRRALRVSQDHGVKLEILEFRGHQGNGGIRGVTDYLDRKAQRGGEETLEQRGDLDLMGQKG